MLAGTKKKKKKRAPRIPSCTLTIHLLLLPPLLPPSTRFLPLGFVPPRHSFRREFPEDCYAVHNCLPRRGALSTTQATNPPTALSRPIPDRAYRVALYPNIRTLSSRISNETNHHKQHLEARHLTAAAKMVYVRQEYLPNLRQYKYSGVDHSLLSRYVLKPFYTNVVIKCFPMSMAPNLITLTGFMFVIANFLTLLWYNPTLDQDCPTWVYYSWAVGLFLYQTFDAVDGSQA